VTYPVRVRVKHTINYTKLYKKVIYYQFFVISYGASCHGVSCHGASCPWGKLSVGRVVHGASGPWGEWSMGRVVRGVSGPYGKLSMVRNDCESSCRGASLDGASCPWGKFRWDEWSGNLQDSLQKEGSTTPGPQRTSLLTYSRTLQNLITFLTIIL
jgi:hypothetical protein